MSQRETLAPGVELEIVKRAEQRLHVDMEVLSIDKSTVTVRLGLEGASQTLSKGDILRLTLDIKGLPT